MEEITSDVRNLQLLKKRISTRDQRDAMKKKKEEKADYLRKHYIKKKNER